LKFFFLSSSRQEEEEEENLFIFRNFVVGEKRRKKGGKEKVEADGFSSRQRGLPTSARAANEHQFSSSSSFCVCVTFLANLVLVLG
jgi:hypothetical protein